MELIYDRNIAVLEKRGFPVQALSSACGMNHSDFHLVTETAADGNKTAKIQFSDQALYLHSKYSPANEAAMFEKNMNLWVGYTLICFGLGLGYHLEAVRANMLQSNRLLIIEPDASFLNQLLQAHDFEELLSDDRVELLLMVDESQLMNRMRSVITWKTVQSIELTKLSAYAAAFRNVYGKALEGINKLITESMVTCNTLSAQGARWAQNMVTNIQYVFDSIPAGDFYGKFNGKPVVIVSAGPSLDKNVHLLKEVYDKAFVICVYTAFKVLQKHEITPDMIISVDTRQLFMETPQESQQPIRTPLLFCPSADKRLLKKHVGPKILALTDTDVFWMDTLKKLGVDVAKSRLYSGGTVAAFAMDFAVQAGAGVIIFIGQDLAYTNQRSHASGSKYEDDTEYGRKNSKVMVEDVYGNLVETDHIFHMYLQYMEQFINLDKSGRVYVDATEGGALIRGTRIMPFAEAIRRYCKFDGIRRTIVNVLEHKRTYAKEDILLLIGKLKSTQQAIEEMLHLQDEIEFLQWENMGACTDDYQNLQNPVFLNRMAQGEALHKRYMALQENADMLTIIFDAAAVRTAENRNNEKRQFEETGSLRRKKNDAVETNRRQVAAIKATNTLIEEGEILQAFTQSIAALEASL